MHDHFHSQSKNLFCNFHIKLFITEVCTNILQLRSKETALGELIEAWIGRNPDNGVEEVLNSMAKAFALSPQNHRLVFEGLRAHAERDYQQAGFLVRVCVHWTFDHLWPVFWFHRIMYSWKNAINLEHNPLSSHCTFVFVALHILVIYPFSFRGSSFGATAFGTPLIRALAGTTWKFVFRWVAEFCFGGLGYMAGPGMVISTWPVTRHPETNGKASPEGFGKIFHISKWIAPALKAAWIFSFVSMGICFGMPRKCWAKLALFTLAGIERLSAVFTQPLNALSLEEWGKNVIIASELGRARNLKLKVCFGILGNFEHDAGNLWILYSWKNAITVIYF